MIRAALETLRRVQTDVLASDVVYRRGSGDVPLRAVVGRSVFRSQNSSGLWIGTSSHDFIVASDALGFEPSPGDIIIFDGLEYEVLALGGESVWRWSDPHRTAVRIHTKLIGEAS